MLISPKNPYTSKLHKMTKTLWVSPDATWGLRELSQFIEREGCGGPVTVDFLVKNANSKLVGQVWVALNSYSPESATYKAFNHFLLPGEGDNKPLKAVDMLNNAYKSAAESSSLKYKEDIDRIINWMTRGNEVPQKELRSLSQKLMSEPLLKGLLNNKKEFKQSIKFNALDYKNKRGNFESGKMMFDRRLKNIADMTELDIAKHLIKKDGLVFQKGKQVMSADIRFTDLLAWTGKQAFKFLPFGKIPERIEKWDNSWADVNGLATQLALDTLKVALMIPAIAAAGKAKALAWTGQVGLAALQTMSDASGVTLWALENGFPKLERYTTGNRGIGKNLEVKPVGFQAKELKSKCEDKSEPEESTEKISPPKCEKEWSDISATFVETCTGDFDGGFQYQGEVSVDSSSRTQVANNQRRDEFKLTRIDGDSGSRDPFIPKLTTDIGSDELVRLWVTPGGSPTWNFIFYGSAYMEARRRCINKTRSEDDQLSYSQVEQMFLDKEKDNRTYVNGVYNGFNDKPPYRIDISTGSTTPIDIIKAEAFRALPATEDWGSSPNYVCTESIYPDSRTYELELVPMAYS